MPRKRDRNRRASVPRAAWSSECPTCSTRRSCARAAVVSSRAYSARFGSSCSMIASMTRSHSREQREIVLGVADLDQRGALGVHERGGLRSSWRARGRFARRRCVPVGLRRRHVEQHHRNSGRRRERRDPAAHRPRAHHAQFPNSHSNVSPRPSVFSPTRNGKRNLHALVRDSATRKGNRQELADDCEVFLLFFPLNGRRFRVT